MVSVEAIDRDGVQSFGNTKGAECRKVGKIERIAKSTGRTVRQATTAAREVAKVFFGM